MPQITDADREAAQSLRAVLADLSGFWFKGDDDSALCAALALHRIAAEQAARRASVPAPAPMDDRMFGPRLELRIEPGLLARRLVATNGRDRSAAT